MDASGIDKSRRLAASEAAAMGGALRYVRRALDIGQVTLTEQADLSNQSIVANAERGVIRSRATLERIGLALCTLALKRLGPEKLREAIKEAATSGDMKSPISLGELVDRVTEHQAAIETWGALIAPHVQRVFAEVALELRRRKRGRRS